MPDLKLLPPELATAICEGIAITQSAPFHDLSYGQRCVINRLLGPHDQPEKVSGLCGIGRWRRYKLADITTRRVLQCWERLLPQDKLPHECLEAAYRVLNGQLSQSECEQLREDGWNHCGELVYKHQDAQNDVLPGYAALQVVRIALWDNLYPEVVELEITDGDLDPENLDYSYCAAAAFAGGTVWNDSSSASRRLEFWQWWLTEAVPAAWHSQLGS